MRILDRLVVTSFLMLFCIFLLCAPPLFVLGDLVNSHEFAAERGIPICYTLNTGTVETNWRAYQEEHSKTHGVELGLREKQSIMKPVYVAPTTEQEKRCSRGHQSTVWPSRARHGGTKKYIETEQKLSAQDHGDDWFDFLHRHNIVLAGTPGHVSGQLEMHR